MYNFPAGEMDWDSMVAKGTKKTDFLDDLLYLQGS